MHNNFQFCAEEYLFLVLIYHGLVSGFLGVFLAFLPTKIKIKNSKQQNFIFKTLSLKMLIRGEGLYMI